MTDTTRVLHADEHLPSAGTPLIEMADVGKFYGAIRALQRHQPAGQRRRGDLRAG